MMNTLPDKFLFMKVGNHAGESWEQILERKRREYQRTGQTFWGYGGTTCHPLSIVQPFARLAVKEQGTIMLVMHNFDSKAEPEIVPAKEFSSDGIHWLPIPEDIVVTGSRYALVLDEIRPGDLEVALYDYEVAVGPSAGKAAELYLQGHVDKGCFVRSQQSRGPEAERERLIRKIGFSAELQEPYAVLLR
jgi:hypothetical protein